VQARLSNTEARALAAAVLGVAPEATEEVARRAWWDGVRQHHPDRGGDAARLHAVQAAWQVWRGTAVPRGGAATVAAGRPRTPPRIIPGAEARDWDVRPFDPPPVSG
jgi:hypothetical protein